MEHTQTPTALPGVLILSQNIGEALVMAKSIYLKSYTPVNEKLHGRLCQNIIDIKLDAPFVSEEYTLDTNYYNCNVRLACFSYGSFLPILESENHEELLQNHGISSVEGLIFVSNVKPKQREGVEQYLKYNNEVIGKLNPEFMMCFANTEPNYDSEELFEIFKFGENELFVEVVNDDLDGVEPTVPDRTLPKSKFEEKYGLDRVIENIECHMWPNMERKEVQKNTGDKKAPVEVTKEPVKTVAVEEKKEEKPAKAEVVIEKQEEKENKEEKVNKEEEVNGKNKEQEVQEVKETAEKKKKDEKKAAEAKKAETNPLEWVDEDEKEMTDLAAVFETVRQFKMNSQNLTDEERRERAADLIMKLVSNCKELQDESDEDDD